MLCVSDLDFGKVYKSSLAVGLSGLLEHATILCSTELNNKKVRYHSRFLPRKPSYNLTCFPAQTHVLQLVLRQPHTHQLQINDQSSTASLSKQDLISRSSPRALD